MYAKDIMTPNVVTVGPDMSVAEAARLLIERHISAAPVVDADGKLVGILSEGDLVHRIKGEHELPRSWWLALFGDPEDDPREYLKSHGSKVSDVMTADVITVPPEAGIAEMAETLETKKIKRVPVVEGGRLLGIVSRANLIQTLVAQPAETLPQVAADDKEIRAKLLANIQTLAWYSGATVSLTVIDGVVRFWGWVESDDVKEALRAAAEGVDGIKEIELHVSVGPQDALARAAYM